MVERGLAMLEQELAKQKLAVAEAAAWRDGLVNQLIEVEYGSLWYTCRVVVPVSSTAQQHQHRVFRVRYEEDDTEETLILNSDFTAHQESQADVFQWRFKTEDIALEKASKIEKQAQAKALLTEQRANAKAMKIERDAAARALRVEREAQSKAQQVEREAQQRCDELEQAARARATDVDQKASEAAQRYMADARKRIVEEAAAAAAKQKQKQQQQHKEEEISSEEEEEEESEEEEPVVQRREPSTRKSKPVDVFKPPPLSAAAAARRRSFPTSASASASSTKKRARHSEPAAQVVVVPPSASPRQQQRKSPKLNALGYIPKGRFGFVPPEKEDAVGWRVRVYWKDDKTFYRGQIESYAGGKQQNKKHQIIYEDGEEELIKLSAERVEWYLPADSEFELYGIDVAEALEAQAQSSTTRRRG